MTQKWSQNDPKMTQKWPKNDPKMTWNWLKNDPKMTSKWLQNDSKNDPKMTCNWLKNDMELTQKWLQNDLDMTGKWLQMTLKWLKNDPKMTQKWLETWKETERAGAPGFMGKLEANSNWIEWDECYRSCWEWDSTLRSSIAFIVFLLVTWYFEPFVLPLMLLLYFLHNFIVRQVPDIVTALRANTPRFNVQRLVFRLFCLGQLRSFGNPSVKEYESDSSYLDDDDDDADDKNKVTLPPLETCETGSWFQSGRRRRGVWKRSCRPSKKWRWRSKIQSAL